MATIGSYPELRTFFAQEPLPPFCKQREWDDFRNRFSTAPTDLTKPLSQLPVDYSRGTVSSNWKDRAWKILRIFLMIIFFPWGLYAAIKYLLQRLVMTITFPLQSGILTLKWNRLDALAELRKEIQTNLNQARNQTHPEPQSREPVGKEFENPYLLRQVVLGKEDRRYRALMIATGQSISSGIWMLHAPGNTKPIECCAVQYAHYYTKYCNASLLIVHGPGAVGNDGEVPTTDLGEPCELALSCIETHFKAKQIILSGHSLGGASIGQAIKQHTFKTEKHKYVVVRQMTFDSTGNMGYRRVGFNKWFTSPPLGRMVECLVKWTNCHIDNVEASRILQDKKIVEIIVQAGKDKVIPHEASLSWALGEQGITGNKIFEFLPDNGHNSMLVSLFSILEKHPSGMAFLNPSC